VTHSIGGVQFGVDLAAIDERRSSGELWRDFVQFSQAQLDAQDVDPVYPVLRILQRDLTREQRFWHTFLYVAFYNIASAEEAFAYVNELGTLPAELASLPTGVERRGLRGGQPLNRHLASLAEIAHAEGSLEAWITGWETAPETPDERMAAYRIVRDVKLRQPWGNGRWAAYKTAEILQKVNGLPLQATDMGNDDSTGPRQGLELLFGKPEGSAAEQLETLDKLGVVVMDTLNDELRGWLHSHPVFMLRGDVTIDEVETMLCDFHALVDGRYYVGHDIDQMHDQLKRSKAQQFMWNAWRARREIFEPRWLAEVVGRDPAVEPDRKRAYAELGIILTR
jgi:hypothetical protein